MILILKDPLSDRAEYLGEMLSLWGLTCWEVVPGGDGRLASAATIIVPPGVTAEADALRSALGKGAHIVLIAPEMESLKLLGITGAASYGDDGGLSYVRLVHPLLNGFSHHALPVVGRRALASGQHYQAAAHRAEAPPEATVWAYLYEPGLALVDRPAIWTVPASAGRVSVFSYDLVECYRDLRQGRPRYAGWRPDWDDICRPAYLFGPDWFRQFRGAFAPVADFHPMLLVRLIEQHTEAPLPRLWTLPGTQRSAILVSGDEDGCDATCSERICSFLDPLGAAMTIYIYMQNPRAEPRQVDAWMKAGHSFSVHPYPLRAGENQLVPRETVLPHLERCALDFKTRYKLPTRAVRNHRCFWTGYADIPRLWEKLGVEMDTNYVSSAICVRDFAGYYHAPAAVLPMPFADENLRLINVLQQPVAGTDDAELGPRTMGPKGKDLSPAMFEEFGRWLLRNALEPLGLPFAFVFHPGNYVRFAGEAEERFLRAAKAGGAALISDYAWLDFWQARRQWKMVETSRAGSDIRYRFQGSARGAAVSLTLPQQHGGKDLSAVQVNGRRVEVAPISHFGESRVLIPLPEAREETVVAATY